MGIASGLRIAIATICLSMPRRDTKSLRSVMLFTGRLPRHATPSRRNSEGHGAQLSTLHAATVFS